MVQVSLNLAQSKPPVTAVSLLNALGERLGAGGWKVRLLAPAGPPELKVTNPAVPLMADRIMAALMADGSWWFWWSFGERIADADDLDQAVTVIGRVLGLAEPFPLAGPGAGSRRWPGAAAIGDSPCPSWPPWLA